MSDFAFSTLGDANGGGDFTPISLLTSFAFDESMLFETNSLEGIRVNQTLWHEYQHFLQYTTTTFGLNAFLWEYDRALFTWVCIKELLKVVPRVEFPLLQWRKRLDNPRAIEIIDHYHESISHREETIGVLLGDCTFDTASQSILFRGKKVMSPNKSCPFIYPDEGAAYPVALGARAVMEGAASLVELLYLSRKKLHLEMAGKASDMIDTEIAAWEKRRESDPSYFITLDLAAQAGLNPFATLVVSDLALFTPVEIDTLGHPLERSPGHRYLQALEAARNLPQPESMDVQSWYKDYTQVLCNALGWTTPWKMITTKLLDYITDQLPNSPLNSVGLGMTFLRGFVLRNSSAPSLCVYPFPDYPSTEALHNRRGKGPVILNENQVQQLHPPPFVMADGKRAPLMEGLVKANLMSRVRKSLLATLIEKVQLLRMPRIGEDEINQVMMSSLEDYYTGQRLVNLLWHGASRKNPNPCLSVDSTARPGCRGGVTGIHNADVGDCNCKKVLENFLPCSLNDVKWVEG